MGRKSIYDDSPRKRQRGSRSYAVCGHDDRVAAPEFAHINFREFDRALDKFLVEREPGCAAMRAQQYGRAMRGLKKRAKGSVSSDQGDKSAKRWWEGGEA